MPDLVATDRSFGTTCLTGACADSSVLATTGARVLSDFDSPGNRSLCAAWGVREEDEKEFDRDDEDEDDDFDDDDLDDEEFLDDDDDDEDDEDEDDDEVETGDDEKR